MVAPMERDDGSGEDWLVHEAHDWGVPTPAVSSSQREPSSRSTPLDSGESDEAMPKAVLWAMEDRRHSSVRPERTTRRQVGSGNSTLYAIDDGLEHYMIGRLVGTDADGAVYCLVARITARRFDDLEAAVVPLDDAFGDASDIELTSVFQDQSVSNVVNVGHYRRAQEIPPEYLPPSPAQRFT